MIDTGDLRKGLTIELDGNLYSIVDWEHNKTGRGGAVVRLKLRDVRAGHIFERTWPAGSKFQRARVERQPAQYLYADGDIPVHADTTTIYVRVEEDSPSIRLFALLLHDVPWKPRVGHEINAANRGIGYAHLTYDQGNVLHTR